MGGATGEAHQEDTAALALQLCRAAFRRLEHQHLTMTPGHAHQKLARVGRAGLFIGHEQQRHRRRIGLAHHGRQDRHPYRDPPLHVENTRTRGPLTLERPGHGGKGLGRPDRVQVAQEKRPTVPVGNRGQHGVSGWRAVSELRRDATLAQPVVDPQPQSRHERGVRGRALEEDEILQIGAQAWQVRFEGGEPVPWHGETILRPAAGGE